MQQWLECHRKSPEPQFVVSRGQELGAHQMGTREAPEVSHSPMGKVGSVVPANPCADKSGTAALFGCLFLPHNCDRSRSSHSLHTKKHKMLGQAQHLLAT